MTCTWQDQLIQPLLQEALRPDNKNDVCGLYAESALQTRHIACSSTVAAALRGSLPPTIAEPSVRSITIYVDMLDILTVPFAELEGAGATANGLHMHCMSGGGCIIG